MMEDFHPAAEIFPPMNDKELADLAADIRVNGLREPIVRMNGIVLDGRNRLRACGIAGIVPQFEEWTGDSPAS